VRASVRWLPPVRLSVVAVAAFVVMLAGAPVAAHAGSSAGTTATTCARFGQGSTGTAVKTVQKLVGSTVDGDFGPATAAALRTWQAAHAVTVTGVVDAATWAALPATTGRLACGQRVRGTGVTLTCASLSTGTSGLAVAVLQKSLGLPVDATFGATTRDAVKHVQQVAGIAVTGATDRPTWRALKLRGTPECSTAWTVAPRKPQDWKAQATVRKKVATLAAELLKRPGTTTNPVALQAMTFGERQVGKPYVWGGTGPKGYDCSGLQMASYLHAGIGIPRTAAEQYASAGPRVPLNEAQQGDLVFYASDVTRPTTVYHVAMYVGGGQVLDSPETGEKVRIVPLWTTDLLPLVVRPVAALALPVKLGASGWTVTQLQQDLDRRGASLLVDGGFGPATDVAVRGWQKAHHLTINGVVGVATWLTLK
jgi:cell wall-associated NlpC family hydrolase